MVKEIPHKTKSLELNPHFIKTALTVVSEWFLLAGAKMCLKVCLPHSLIVLKPLA